MNNIRKLREEKGLSQEKLGEKFHLSQQSIAKYEGELSSPDIDTLKGMAKLFSTTIDYIVGNTDNPILPGDNNTTINGKIISRNEAALIENYRKLNPELQNSIDTIIEHLVVEDYKDKQK